MRSSFFFYVRIGVRVDVRARLRARCSGRPSPTAGRAACSSLWLILMIFVITSAISHVRRVRLVNGSANGGIAGQPPAPADRDADGSRTGRSTSSTRRSASCPTSRTWRARATACRSARRCAACTPTAARCRCCSACSGGSARRATRSSRPSRRSRGHGHREPGLRARGRRVARLVHRGQRHQPRERRGDHPRDLAPHHRSAPRRAGVDQGDARPRRSSRSPSCSCCTRRSSRTSSTTRSAARKYLVRSDPAGRGTDHRQPDPVPAPFAAAAGRMRSRRWARSSSACAPISRSCRSAWARA